MQPERARIEGVCTLSSAQRFSLFIWVLERHWNMTESSQSEIMCFSSKILCVQIKLGCAKRKRCDFFFLSFSLFFLILMCAWEVGLCFVFWRLLQSKGPSLEVWHINLTERECKVFLVTIHIPPRDATSDCVTILVSLVNHFEKSESERLWVWGLAMTGRKKKKTVLFFSTACVIGYYCSKQQRLQ